MRTTVIAVVMMVLTSFTIYGTKKIASPEGEVKTIEVSPKKSDKKLNTNGTSTLIYTVDGEEVDVIKEFGPGMMSNGNFTTMANQAMVNEILVNLLKRGYMVESVIDVPTTDGNGTKRCVGLTKALSSSEDEMIL